MPFVDERIQADGFGDDPAGWLEIFGQLMSESCRPQSSLNGFFTRSRNSVSTAILRHVHFTWHFPTYFPDVFPEVFLGLAMEDFQLDFLEDYNQSTCTAPARRPRNYTTNARWATELRVAST